ncbi:MAG: sialidase family protein, partial [Planctomycetia bacterium]
MNTHPLKPLLCLAASVLAAIAAAAEPVAEVARPLAEARFVVPPETVVAHTPQREFIGPGTIVLENGDILMAAPWGRPPANFEQLAATFPVPPLYRSTDGGRTWATAGRFKMEWPLTGRVSDQGISFLRLKDGRLAAILPRHVLGLHGGGVPAISFSHDDGATWSAA